MDSLSLHYDALIYLQQENRRQLVATVTQGRTIIKNSKIIDIV